MHSGVISQLTRQGAAEHLDPHTQTAVPALRDDPDVTGDYGLRQLVHHRSVLITVSKEQLEERRARERKKPKQGRKANKSMIYEGILVFREVAQISRHRITRCSEAPRHFLVSGL